MKGQNVSVCPDNIFETAKPLKKSSLSDLYIYFTKLGVVMHYHEPECHAKRLICYIQGQAGSKGSYDQNMTVPTIFSELLILLLPAWFDSKLL